MRHGTIFISLAVGIVLFFILGGTSVRADTGSSLWPTPDTTPMPRFNMVPAGPLAMMGTNCGTLGGLHHVGDPAGQERCLYEAYLHCQTATLLYLQASVDTGEYQYLTVLRRGSVCAVTERVAPYGVAASPPHTYVCQGLLFLPTTGTVGGLIAQQCEEKGDVQIPYAFA